MGKAYSKTNQKMVRRWFFNESVKTPIYKYRSINTNTLKIFINFELYLANPESFNDPFDGQLDLLKALNEYSKMENQNASSININLIPDLVKA